MHQLPRVVSWEGDCLTGRLVLLDQTRLPQEESYIDCDTIEKVYESILMLRVRGAPAIGVSAAFGLIVAGQKFLNSSVEIFNSELKNASRYLDSSRPTAVNLSWALARMIGVNALFPSQESVPNRLAALLEEAKRIAKEDLEMCHAMARHGQPLIPDGARILTHCNAGMLATSGIGTALGVVHLAHSYGKKVHVYIDETRPLLQGSRLTAWELVRSGVPSTIVCDNMAGMLMAAGKIDLVLVGADRIAANGDTANKIGTYSVAILANYHGIPFYVAAPSSTFDLRLKSGLDIPIEERDPFEIIKNFEGSGYFGKINIYNPAFDCTPAKLITAIITENGLLNPIKDLPFSNN